jgi:hypothetical protein
MKLLASATMTPPPLLIYRRRRREVILSQGEPRIMSETLTTVEANVPPKIAKAAHRAGNWLKHRVTLGRIAAGVAVIYTVTVIEDVATLLGGSL